MTWLRAAVVIVMVLGACRAAAQLIALELVETGSAVALNVAAGWDPDQPEIYFRRGLLQRDTVEHYDLEAACTDLDTATRLNRLNWTYWQELGRCREAQGRAAEAERALQKSLALNPRSGPDHWAMAHFYVRRGDDARAVEHLFEAASLDASLQSGALTLLQQLDVDLQHLQQRWPADRWARLRLLAHLLQRPRSKAISRSLEGVWEDLLAGSQPVTLWEASPYLGSLLNSDPAEARRQWLRVAQHNGLQDPDFAASRNLVWAGHLRDRPTGTLLDWRVPAQPGVRFEVGPEGAILDFDGSANVSGVLLEQLAVVPPGRLLELAVVARADSLSTDQGARIEVRAVPGGRAALNSLHLTGSSPLAAHRMKFESPASGLVRIQLLRRPSSRIDRRISGRLQLERILLQPADKESHEDLSILSDH